MDSIVKQLRSACEDHGEVEFRESYSGRGMYGRSCVGVIGSMQDCLAVIAQVNASLTQEVFEAAIDSTDDTVNGAYETNDTIQEMQTELFRFTYDSMGLDMIIYWPSMVPEPVELPDDEEIELMSVAALGQFLQANEEYVTEDDCLEVTSIRETARIVRDRIREDQQD